MKIIDFEEFEDQYHPLWNTEGDNTPLRIEARDLEEIREHTEELYRNLIPFLWTEFDDDSLQSGYWISNRTCYWLTAVPHNHIKIIVNAPHSEETPDDNS